MLDMYYRVLHVHIINFIHKEITTVSCLQVYDKVDCF